MTLCLGEFRIRMLTGLTLSPVNKSFNPRIPVKRQGRVGRKPSVHLMSKEDISRRKNTTLNIIVETAGVRRPFA